MATPSTSPALLYRQTALGDALVESLDALITEGKISPDLALKVLAEVRIFIGVAFFFSSPSFNLFCSWSRWHRSVVG